MIMHEPNPPSCIKVAGNHVNVNKIHDFYKQLNISRLGCLCRRRFILHFACLSTHRHRTWKVLRPVHNIRLGERRVTCLRRVATGSAYKIIWTRVAYAGIEPISIPAYVHVATRVRINLYALPVATLAHAYGYEPAFRRVPLATTEL